MPSLSNLLYPGLILIFFFFSDLFLSFLIFSFFIFSYLLFSFLFFFLHFVQPALAPPTKEKWETFSLFPHQSRWSGGDRRTLQISQHQQQQHHNIEKKPGGGVRKNTNKAESSRITNGTCCNFCAPLFFSARFLAFNSSSVSFLNILGLFDSQAKKKKIIIRGLF